MKKNKETARVGKYVQEIENSPFGKELGIYTWQKAAFQGFLKIRPLKVYTCITNA